MMLEVVHGGLWGVPTRPICTCVLYMEVAVPGLVSERVLPRGWWVASLG
jgi:hypothetical protein